MLAAEAGRFDHASVAGQPCATCHNGVVAEAKGSAHPRTTDTCVDCHGTIAWVPVTRLDHADVLGACVSCHDGRKYPGKPTNHVVSGNNCDSCHTTSAWLPAAFDHSAVLAGTCITCHNGLTATGLPSRHPMTTASCDSCHYVLGWTPVKPPAPSPTQHTQPAPSKGPVTTPRSRLLSGTVVH